jgi:hypothetical protein
MMNQATKNALISIILSILAVCLFVFVFFFFFHEQRLDPQFNSIKTLKNALHLREASVSTLHAVPVAVIFVNVFCFSVLFTLKPFQTKEFTYNNVALPSFVMLVVFIMFVVSSECLIVPRLEKQSSSLRYRMRVARKAEEYARELDSAQEYGKALSILDVYLDIDEQNEDMIKLYNEIIERREKQEEIRFLGTEELAQEQDTSPTTYYERGKEEYEKGNYFGALYYLERAHALHEDNAEIQELYIRTKRQAEDSLGKLTRAQEKKKQLIESKEKALEHLNKEEHYEAYEIFAKLHREYPEMQDLELYLNEVVSELSKKDFLPQELEEASWLPSIDNVIFRDQQGYVNTVAHIVAHNNQFYFYNITRYKIMKGKLNTFSWKYGKWIQRSIRLKNDEGFKKIPENKLGVQNISTYTDPGYLLYSGDRETLINLLNIYEWFSLSDLLRKSGIDVASKWEYLSRILGIVFSVYVLTLFLSSLAWAKRSIYEFPPVPKLVLFFIVVPVTVYFLHLLYIDMNNLIIYSHRYFTRLMFKGLNVAVYTMLFNIVFSIVSTLYFLSQRSGIE